MKQQPSKGPASANGAIAKPAGSGLVAWLGGLFLSYPAWVGAGLAIVYFALFAFWPRGDAADDWHYRDFGRLPVIENGRCKPLDTVARVDLMIITSRQQYYDPETGVTYPATKWFLDSATVPYPGNQVFQRLFAESDGAAWHYKVFRIENDKVLDLLGLKMRDRLRYSLAEFASKVPDLMSEADALGGDDEHEAKDPKHYTLRDAKIMELAQHVKLYLGISSHTTPLVVPNPDGSDQWKSVGQAVHEMQRGAAAEKDLQIYLKLLALYSPAPNANLPAAEQKRDLAQRQREFNTTLSAHLADLQRRYPDKMRKVDAELFFNEFAPFYLCLALYVGIALLAAGSWLALETRWSAPMRKAAFAATAVAFAVHTFALLMRMWLQDRPPVTNLYSSAIFIGWGCVLISMIVEWIYKNGIAIVVGAVLGFLTLIIAHLLSLDGDTMTMMQAVLDTNFWLATHVTCITLGYTTVFVAGFMGVAYILLGVFTPLLRGENGANLTRMTYGVLCAGMFLSFVGTVLGGLWADYSWGRFWGWDPKENGALLIVIWVALILHARWGGMVKQRGLAVLAVLGIVVTGWSWFGTNFLGVGLHSYGFKDGAMAMLVLVDFLFLGIAGLGMLPMEHWQSFRPPSKMPPPLAP